MRWVCITQTAKSESWFWNSTTVWLAPHSVVTTKLLGR
jgi:hypothetical protein